MCRYERPPQVKSYHDFLADARGYSFTFFGASQNADLIICASVAKSLSCHV
ncbi:MAG: hypothetical protein F6K40_24470 [Okeania sp. SIO3I5]|uniref:hypothetical protein n=1 Tax=Okeania sp. SIO3I5 TaxID=2607805 RepID=UPI0013BB47C0|nr:hypothetical protein [Okeania sp. SIO3I5]NEQ39233.1 hypothetical protein [Okeania sp. SIO3I5]